MTRTVVESKTKTVIIGFDEPFCVIGERINPTGRKKLAAELEAGNFETVIKDALEQVACGATVLDVNSGAVFTNMMAKDPRYADNNFVEPPLMKALIEIIQQTVDVPLCIDSSVPGALEAGLQACEGRPLLNSVTGEEERLELVLPLVKNTTSPSSPSRTTTPASRPTPMSALPWPRRSSNAPPTTASPRMTSSSTRW